MNSFPQQKIDAIQRYVEAIETGQIDFKNGLFPSEPPKEFYQLLEEGTAEKSSTVTKTDTKTYQKPLYVRDKNNPRILYPYKKK